MLSAEQLSDVIRVLRPAKRKLARTPHVHASLVDPMTLIAMLRNAARGMGTLQAKPDLTEQRKLAT
jgi:hypothetical protein